MRKQILSLLALFICLTQAQYGQYIGTYTVQTPVITNKTDPYASIASQSLFPELHKLPSATQPLDTYHRPQPAQQVQFVTATYAVYQTQHKPGFWDAVTGQYNAQEGKYYQGMRHVRVG